MPQVKKFETQLSVPCSLAEKAQLEAIASGRKVSLSFIIREAVDNFLTTQAAKTAKTSRGG